MTFTRDNIVGVEFTVKNNFIPEEYRDKYRIHSIEGNTVWVEYIGGNSYGCNLHEAIEDLNNGTWIVTPKK